jgi:hypothetical protein
MAFVSQISLKILFANSQTLSDLLPSGLRCFFGDVQLYFRLEKIREREKEREREREKEREREVYIKYYL